MILLMILSFLASLGSAEIVKNGDFETGEKDPWICRGCQGHMWGVGHDSENSFYADHRTEEWHGPAQFLTPTDLDSLDSLAVTFMFSLMPDQAMDVRWELMCNNDGKHTQLLYQGSFSANQWKSVSENIVLPELCQGASQVQLLTEGLPVTGSFRIDDISIEGEGSGPTTTPSPVTTTTTSPTTSPTIQTTTMPSPDCSSVFIVESEEDNSWHGLVTISVEEDMASWQVELHFDQKADSVETPLGEVSGAGTSWIIDNKGFDGELHTGDILELRFEVYFTGISPNIVDIVFNNVELCDGAAPPTTPPPDNDCTDKVEIESEDDGRYHGLIVILPTEDTSSWHLELGFTHSVANLVSPLGTVSGSGKSWVVSSKEWDGNLSAGVALEFRFEVYYSGSSRPNINSVIFNEESIC